MTHISNGKTAQTLSRRFNPIRLVILASILVALLALLLVILLSSKNRPNPSRRKRLLVIGGSPPNRLNYTTPAQGRIGVEKMAG